MYKNNYLANRLSTGCKIDKNKIFIKSVNDNKEITYNEFFSINEIVARYLTKNNVKYQDRILYFAPKSITGFNLFYASILIGAVFVSVNPNYGDDDLAYFIEDVQPKIIICHPSDKNKVERALRGKSCVINTLTELEQNIQYTSSDNTPFESIETKKDTIAAILYTSGTTGRPKGVIHTHHSLASNAEVLTKTWHFTEKDILIHTLPIFHLHGLFTATNVALNSGCSMLYFPEFNAENVINIMDKATVLMGVPPHYEALLNYSCLRERTANMRLFISGSAPMLPKTHERWFSETDNMILERYGMTEGSMISSNPYLGTRKVSTVGFPLIGTDLRIVMDDGRPAKTDEIGYIQFKGDNLFSGYWNLPEKTAEEFTQDGYFITGDYGKFDSDGYLSVVGRVKDAINTKDGIVYPKEIEDIIDQIKDIKESALIAVDSINNTNQEALLIVVKKDQLSNDNTSIINVINDKTNKICNLKDIVFLDSLPKNVMGKVQKVLLRNKYN
ncbi:AMP-binding protein [Providencia rettgeri]|uniref:AMP-binding protein n=1 Tax=Providencia rettgeri TaxID=587 RepID=UPI0032DAB6AE